MAGLIDNIALLNFGGSGNYNSNSNNRFETTNVSVDGDVAHAVDLARSAGGMGTMTHQFVVEPSDATADGTVRLSVGLEDLEDLREDVERGLAAAFG